MGWGGARRNAGRRKAETFTVPALSAGLAAELFHDPGQLENKDKKLERRLSTKERWERLRATNDENLAFRVEQYIWDRAEGKPTIFVSQEPEKPPADVSFGSLDMPTAQPAADQPRKAGKPN